MSIIGDWAKCFEECGVKLPDGYEFTPCGGAMFDPGTECECSIPTHAALDMCRMEAMRQLRFPTIWEPREMDERVDEWGVALEYPCSMGETLDAALQAALRARKEQGR